jgi:hypothetical protein
MPEYTEDFGDEDPTLEAPEPSEEILEAAHEADGSVTDDSVPDGTAPVSEVDATLVEEGDAGVNDTGDEEWYQDGDA